MRGNKKPRRMRYLKSLDEVPRFKSEAAEAEYWSAHSLARIWDKLEPVEFEIAPKLRHVFLGKRRKKPVTLRLEERQVEAAKRIARVKSLSYQALMRSWINEGIVREERKKF